jgi:hypothetical protein
MTLQKLPPPAGFAGRAIHRLLCIIRERRARKRLQEIVDQTRASFDCEQYRRRRAAALKGLRKA